MKSTRETLALLAAARSDGPDAVAREAIWSKLEVAVGFIPPPEPSGVRSIDNPPHAPTPSPSASGSVGSAAKASTSTVFKAGLLGGGIGSALTVGGVFLALHMGVTPLAPSPALDTSHEMRSGDRAPSILAPLVSPPAESEPSAQEAQPTPPPAAATDVLSREVTLVMDAREQLLNGDPARALDLAHKARGLHGQLDREALTLEVRALRALHRDAEADRAEMELRVLHPTR